MPNAEFSIRLPVLIAGAGLGGLVLAQALKKASIPFLIFERDVSPNSRTQGWGLTIQQWSLPKFMTLLPTSISSRLDEALVDPVYGTSNEDMLFVDLSTAEPKLRIASSRKRMNRNRLRDLLCEGLTDDIKWDKRLTSYTLTEHGVKARFHDGSEYEGFLLAGVDGAHSITRSLLLPKGSGELNILPVQCLGFDIDLTKEQIEPIRKIDPVLFLGCHPKTETYMWTSLVDTPEGNGTACLPPSEQKWSLHMSVSWISSVEVPDTNPERVDVLRSRTTDFAPPLRKLYHELLPREGTLVTLLTVADWVPPEEPWDNLDGRVTIAGDAAHPMTMYRGAAFNNALIDIYNLFSALQHIYQASSSGSFANSSSQRRKSFIDEYEKELRERGRKAVLESHDACLSYHDWSKTEAIAAQTRQGWVFKHVQNVKER